MTGKFIPLYDLESLTEPQRYDYVRGVCEHMGVPPELNLVMLTYLDENDGPRRLVAYAKRGATEIIRNNRGINVTDLTSKEIQGSVVYTATGKDSTGRQEMSTGAKYVVGLVGKELDDAIMTAQTRACRRMTLQFVGAGVLDESEVNPAHRVELKETNLLPPVPQPIVAPANEPGKDVTTTVTKAAVELANVMSQAFTGQDVIIPIEETQEQFETHQAKLCADAIAQLNQSASPVEPAKRTRKTRGPNKPKVDMGPSEPVLQPVLQPVSATVAPATPNEPEKAASGNGTRLSPTLAVAEPVSVLQSGTTIPVQGTAPQKPRLSAELVKPFRQRLFKIVNDQLEPAGFAPKEGVGNQDKMRQFASMMFPEVTSMNELTVEQWEKYLTSIETKINTQGAAAAIKYIEDAIGI
jgi:hypothetical protein